MSGVDGSAINAAYLEADREQALKSLATRTVDEAAAVILEASKRATPNPPRTPMATQAPVATAAPAASETPAPSPSAGPTAAAAP